MGKWGGARGVCFPSPLGGKQKEVAFVNGLKKEKDNELNKDLIVRVLVPGYLMEE